MGQLRQRLGHLRQTVYKDGATSSGYYIQLDLILEVSFRTSRLVFTAQKGTDELTPHIQWYWRSCPTTIRELTKLPHYVKGTDEDAPPWGNFVRADWNFKMMMFVGQKQIIIWFFMTKMSNRGTMSYRLKNVLIHPSVFLPGSKDPKTWRSCPTLPYKFS